MSWPPAPNQTLPGQRPSFRAAPDQRPDQVQESLMFGISLNSAEERADIDIARPTA
jgi:hypothetical protein